MSSIFSRAAAVVTSLNVEPGVNLAESTLLIYVPDCTEEGSAPAAGSIVGELTMQIISPVFQL